VLFLKNCWKPLLISFISILVLTFIITLFNYINLFSLNIVNIFSYIIPFISFFIGGILLGKKSINKGWLEGIKLGLICIFILFVFNFLAFNQGYSISNFINYGIVLISNILGSMIGINTKKDR